MKTGQKKFDARFGWGVVREVTDKSVKVQFAIDVCEYTLEGKDQAHQLVAMLRDEEYDMYSKHTFASLCLFLGKASEIIGVENTVELLKECKEAFKG
jgi:hypothetical protein